MHQVGKFYKYGPPKHVPLRYRLYRAWRILRRSIRECLEDIYEVIFVNTTEPTAVECEEAESTMMEYVITPPRPFISVHETKPHDND